MHLAVYVNTWRREVLTTDWDGGIKVWTLRVHTGGNGTASAVTTAIESVKGFLRIHAGVRTHPTVQRADALVTECVVLL
jgi:hypothetical protein